MVSDPLTLKQQATFHLLSGILVSMQPPSTRHHINVRISYISYGSFVTSISSSRQISCSHMLGAIPVIVYD
jgi:hypothetical protein